MRCLVLVGLLGILLASPVAWGTESKPAETIAGLKQETDAAGEELERGRKPGTTEAERKAAVDRYYERVGDIGRRALGLAKASPGTPEAIEALIWTTLVGADAESDAAYDLMAESYLAFDAILPVCRIAWSNPQDSSHPEAFLRAAMERSPNVKVRALSCFSLGRRQQELADMIQDLDDPIWGKILEANLKPATIRRLREMKPEPLNREAEALYERTLKEFADLRPLGTDFPPLGEQAEGALFRIHKLTIGSAVPELEAEDLDGKAMKLSESRGKVTVVSFWATWCGPCMGMVPDEKALVERMKGRPFVLIGINGDDDREAAKAIVAKEGMNWRSFWDGGRIKGITVKWGVKQWPTVYVIDAKGVIRFEGLRGPALDKAVEVLVAEAEASRRSE